MYFIELQSYHNYKIKIYDKKLKSINYAIKDFSESRFDISWIREFNLIYQDDIFYMKLITDFIDPVYWVDIGRGYSKSMNLRYAEVEETLKIKGTTCWIAFDLDNNIQIRVITSNHEIIELENEVMNVQ